MEEQEILRERYMLSMERIGQIENEDTLKEPYRSYFKRMAAFFMQIQNLVCDLERGHMQELSFEEYRSYNRSLYEDIVGEAYEKSYANPSYAAACLGNDYGQLLAFVYTEFRAAIADAYERKQEEITIACELLIELYNMFEEGCPAYEELKNTVYWFISDYSDILYADGIRTSFDPSLTFAKDIVMKQDLADLRYLFAYGEYITDNEIRMAEFMNQLSENEVKRMADTYVEGYQRGFILGNKDLSKKKTVKIEYPIGMERMVRSAIIRFEKMGLQSILHRYAVHSVNKKKSGKRGFSAVSANKQFDYDHQQDDALYFDKAFYERKMSVLKVNFEKYSDLIGTYAGPAVIESFGEEPFEPAAKPENVTYSPKQQKLSVEFLAEANQIANAYLHPEETSFTIIAFPTPEIDANFEEIFSDTLKINTLEYDIYSSVQQCIIDALDESDCVRIVGKGGNQTDLTVNLVQLNNPEKETKFENCLADVNIPLGEVFTSPMLKGTNGILHVGEVFLRGLKYVDLEVTLKDGCVTDYICKNFDTEEMNQAYFRDHVMQNHDTLPLGEFAIGTNTAAYAMAKKYGIIQKLPILIVEKMGPHFALGDTCYSHSEEVAVYNPDGKEIVAKDNEYSMLRKTDKSKAYFNCHTDITIPYDEIGEISCCGKNGEKKIIIQDGRFVLPGTEILNEALDSLQ